MTAFKGQGTGVRVVVGAAGAIRYPSTTTPHLGTGTATAADSRIKGVPRVLIHGYVIDVAAPAARIVCVGGDGTTEIGGTGITCSSAASPGQTTVLFPGDGIVWEPPTLDTIATGHGANFGISCGAGITASALFTPLRGN